MIITEIYFSVPKKSESDIGKFSGTYSAVKHVCEEENHGDKKRRIH